MVGSCLRKCWMQGSGAGQWRRCSGGSHGGRGGGVREMGPWAGSCCDREPRTPLETHAFRICSFSPFSICRSRSFTAV